METYNTIVTKIIGPRNILKENMKMIHYSKIKS